MDNSDKLDNQGNGTVGTSKSDGSVPSNYEDNIDPGVVGTDADDAGYQVNVDPVTGIKGGTPSPYKGSGDTLGPMGQDPRFS